MLQHRVEKGNRIRPQPFQVRDHAMSLDGKDEVVRCLIDPFCDGRQGRKPIPHAIQFHRAISCRVVLQKCSLFESGRIKPFRPLPGLVGIAGEPDANVCHRTTVV